MAGASTKGCTGWSVQQVEVLLLLLLHHGDGVHHGSGGGAAAGGGDNDSLGQQAASSVRGLKKRCLGDESPWNQPPFFI